MTNHRGEHATLRGNARAGTDQAFDRLLLWPWERPRGRGGPFPNIYILGLVPGAAMVGFGIRNMSTLGYTLIWAVPLAVIGGAWCCYIALMLLTRSARPIVRTPEATAALIIGHRRRQKLRRHQDQSN